MRGSGCDSPGLLDTASGFAIWAKRLEAGTFAIPSGEPGAKRFEITVEELGALLSGINLEQANRRKRFQRSAA